MLFEGYRERGELGKWLVVCGCLANGISDKKHYFIYMKHFDMIRIFLHNVGLQWVDLY